MQERKKEKIGNNGFYFYYNSPIGILRIEETDGGISGIYAKEKRFFEEEKTEQYQETVLIKKAYEELQEYFAGKRKEFDLPLHVEGTEFQKKVWEQLRQIPYGETRSYGEIAAAIGNPKASRAVGGACHKNGILIVIPCHRVIGADGSLTGFGGGMDMKETLLRGEGIL